MEFGESQLEGAVHENKMMREVRKKIMLELSNKKGDGKKNWQNVTKFLSKQSTVQETEENEVEDSDEEKNGSKLNRDKTGGESLEHPPAAASRNQSREHKTRQEIAQRLDEEEEEDDSQEGVTKPLTPVREKKFVVEAESESDGEVDVQEVQMEIPMDEGDDDEPAVAIDRPQTAKSDAARRLQQASMESAKIKEQLEKIKQQQAVIAAKKSQPQEDEEEYYEEGEEEQDEL